MKIERLGEDRILIQIYDKSTEYVISDNLAEEIASNLNLIKFCGPINKEIAALYSCEEFTETVYIQGRRHCKVCEKPENEQD